MIRGCALLLLAVAVLAACAGPEAENDQALAVLERARTLHQQAARLASRGDTAGAVEALEAVTRLRFPAGAPEAEDVAVDALGQMSRVLLAAGRSVEAEAAARRAIARATRDSFFLGLAYLRLGDALRARGRQRAAVDAFERSIAVNRSVLDELRRTGR